MPAMKSSVRNISMKGLDEGSGGKTGTIINIGTRARNNTGRSFQIFLLPFGGTSTESVLCRTESIIVLSPLRS